MSDTLPRPIEQSIRELIVRIPNFPRPPITFTDITPILERDPVAFRAIIDQMCVPHRSQPPDVIVCIESFGYLFGAPVAYVLERRIILARRAGKLPRPTLHRTYAMGYDPHREMEIHADAIPAGSRVLIVDDVLAVGGTALAAVDLVEQANGRICGVSVAVELTRFNARTRIEARGVPVHAVIQL